MKEQLETYLEKVFSEYLECKGFLQNIVKPMEELRKNAAEKITATTTPQQAEEIYFKEVEKILLHQTDFQNQLQRLFYTVEAYKEAMEIPQEIVKEVSTLQFMQIFAIKNGKEEVINEKALEYTVEQIKNEMQNGVEEFKKRHL